MADKRQYAYYIKGNKIALVQIEDTVSTSAGDFNSEYGMYKSPFETIADGLEIQYTYSPDYLIESTDVSTTTVASWDQDNNGNLRFHASAGTDWTSSPDLSGIPSSSSPYIVLRNAGRWNGLHKVSSVTNNRIVTTTKASTSTSETLFEETVTLYYDVDVLNDESDIIDLPEYLTKALVYYVKAQLAEDQGDMERFEYNRKQFRALMQRYESSRTWGSRRVFPGIGAIK